MSQLAKVGSLYSKCLIKMECNRAILVPIGPEMAWFKFSLVSRGVLMKSGH
ncbi:hypothetical protein [Caballeronia pedi]|uniref:hypothetical protein n=1 Tax=Caballeronia pedi TaxID=1777141 RepID=UPI001358A2E8|nr:hypothetical protein [Caballeronia pedi]